MPRPEIRQVSMRSLAQDLRRAIAQARERFKCLRVETFNPEAPDAPEQLSELSDGFFKFYKGHELDDPMAGEWGMKRLPDGTTVEKSDDPNARRRRGSHRIYFLECRVGEAHVGDPDRAGSRRLVLRISSKRIDRMYFTNGHYRVGPWLELT